MSIAVHDYAYLAGFLFEKTGLDLGGDKQYLVENRLSPLAGDLGCSDVADIIFKLRVMKDPSLAQAVIEAMTTNETSFFRDTVPFDALRDVMLPELRESPRSSRALRIWSAACSTGQEPYSIAMTVRESPLPPDSIVEIVATDINRHALNRARAGVYSEFEVLRGLSLRMLEQYFSAEPRGWRIRDDLRRAIVFKEWNLMESMTELGAFDVVFCRNILIYWDSETKKRVLDRIAETLAPGGFLVLGSAESVLGLSDSFEQVEGVPSSIYRRADAP